MAGSRRPTRTVLWWGAGLLVAATALGVVLAVNVGGSEEAPTATTAEDRVLGEAAAPVTIVEYGDFKCPFCARFFAETEPRLRSEYIDTGKVRLVWRDFANIDAESPVAARAGRCAHAQDSFWEFHDSLYTYIWDTYYSRGTNVEGQSVYPFEELAEQAGLDVARFTDCLQAGTYTEAVAADRRQGQQQGVRGTPTFFVDGERLVGAQPFGVFRELLETALARQ